MAVASFTTDVTGRSLDLEALQTTEGAQLSLVPLSLTVSAKGKSRRITGLQKLVQRYAILFLSAKNTIKYAKSQGTGFLPSVFAGYVQTAEHVSHQFVFANAAVIEQLRRDDSDPAYGTTPPDDERIASASLLDFTIDGANSRLYLQVRIKNLQGDATTYVIPTK